MCPSESQRYSRVEWHIRQAVLLLRRARCPGSWWCSVMSLMDRPAVKCLPTFLKRANPNFWPEHCTARSSSVSGDSGSQKCCAHNGSRLSANSRRFFLSGKWSAVFMADKCHMSSLQCSPAGGHASDCLDNSYENYSYIMFNHRATEHLTCKMISSASLKVFCSNSCFVLNVEMKTVMHSMSVIKEHTNTCVCTHVYEPKSFQGAVSVPLMSSMPTENDTIALFTSTWVQFFLFYICVHTCRSGRRTARWWSWL